MRVFLAATSGAAHATPVDEIISIILTAAGPEETDARLQALTPSVAGRVLVLRPLLEGIVAGTGGQQHFDALCKVDSWSDGAWFIEMRGAAFDAVRKAPSRFVEPYLAGNDCALLMISYAFDWPGTSLGPIHECEPALASVLSEFDRDLATMAERIRVGLNPRSQQPRDRILIEALDRYLMAWSKEREEHRSWCGAQR